MRRLVALVLVLDAFLAACAGSRSPSPSPPPLPVPYAAQVHALGCEAAALRMVLASRRVQRTEDQLLQAFGVDGRAPVLNPDGSLQAWGDPYAKFVGDPDGSQTRLTGYGVYFPPVSAAATAAGARVLRAGEQVAPGDLYAAVGAGHVAVAWVSYSPTTGYQPQPVTSYTAFDGRRVTFGQGFEHAVVVAAIRASDVYVLNPEHGAGAQWIPRSTFEAAYAEFGQMAVIVS